MTRVGGGFGRRGTYFRSENLGGGVLKFDGRFWGVIVFDRSRGVKSLVVPRL